MNEVPVGFDWPKACIRLARTVEAIQIIKSLWNEGAKKEKGGTISSNDSNNGFVDFNGQYFKIRNARLYTSASRKIPLYMAASGENATRTAAKYTDGLITVLTPNKSKKLFDIFDQSASDEGKDPNLLEKITKPKISYSEDYDKAFKSIEFWRASSIEDAFNLDISDPRKLQQKAIEEVSNEKIKESTIIITSIDDCIKPIEEYFNAGYTRVYIHSTSPNEIEFIQIFCRKVLPYFKDMHNTRK